MDVGETMEFVEAGSATVVLAVEEDVDVVVTKRLTSVACTSIRIGCAHIVIGPVTCVLMSVWRTVTIVELDDGKVLIQPAYVRVPSAWYSSSVKYENPLNRTSQLSVTQTTGQKPSGDITYEMQHTAVVTAWEITMSADVYPIGHHPGL